MRDYEERGEAAFTPRVRDGQVVQASAEQRVGGAARRRSSASRDNSIRLWDTFTGKLTGIFTGHTGEALDCCFSADGRVLVSASADCTLRLWSVSDHHALCQ